MKLKLTLILFIFVCSNSIQGQIELLNNNENIPWIIKTKIEYTFEDNYSFNVQKKSRTVDDVITESYAKMIKIDYLKDINSASFSNKFLTNKIINLAINGSFDVFDLSTDKKLTKEEILNLIEKKDTVVTFDPENYEEQIQIISRFSPSNISSFYVNQYWYYDLDSKKIITVPYEIIPVATFKKKSKEVFRIKLENWKANNASFNINNEETHWVKETFDIIDFKKNTDSIKGNTDSTFKELLWNKPLKLKEKKAYNSIYPYSNEVISVQHLFSIDHGIIDTVITYDPETYKESYEIIKNDGYDFTDIAGFEVRQIWTFNESELNFCSYLQSISPMVNLKWKTEKENLYPLYRIMN